MPGFQSADLLNRGKRFSDGEWERIEQARALVEREQHPKTSCTIAVVGKYVQLQDAYLSITEALRHGGIGQDAQVHIQYVDAETVTEDNAAQLFAGCDVVCEAFDRAADRLAAMLGLLWTLLAHPGFIAFDAERFRRLIAQDRRAAQLFCFADASASGEGRAGKVLDTLLADPRLRVDGVDRLANAAQIVVGVLAGPDLRLCELGVLMDGLRAHCKTLQEDFLGTANEAGREGTLAAVVLAFGAPAPEGEPTERPLGGRRGKSAKAAKGSLLGATKDRFSDVEHTVYDGQDLDVPTYQRRGIRLTR